MSIFEHVATGLVANAELLTGGRAVVMVNSTAPFATYLVGGAPAPVDWSAPCTTRARVIAAAVRRGSVTMAATQAAMRDAVEKRSPLGRFDSMFDAILTDNRMERYSKHDRKSLVATIKAAIEE